MVSVDIKAFGYWIKKESKAYKFFKKLCWKNYRIFCNRCRGYKIYSISSGRYRCKRCRYTFSDFTGRWINKLRIPRRDWLYILKLFELEVSARKACKEIRLSYPTVLKGYNIIRRAILVQDEEFPLLKGEIEADDTYFGGRRKGRRGRGAEGKVPVFGIIERRGKVKVEVVKDVTASTLLSLAIKRVHRGSIVYTDKFKSYDSLMFCGYRHLRIDHAKKFVQGKVYINTLEGFWAFAKERLIKFHGVSKRNFPFYLKEMEFRYNYRGENIFEILAKYICNLVSNRL